MHENAKSLDIIVRLAICCCAFNSMNYSGSTSDCCFNYLLICILLSLDMNRRVECRCTEPEVSIETRIFRLLVDVDTGYISQQLLV